MAHGLAKMQVKFNLFLLRLLRLSNPLPLSLSLSLSLSFSLSHTLWVCEKWPKESASPSPSLTLFLSGVQL